MILPDVNVLIYAYKEGAVDHTRWLEWLRRTLADAEVGLLEPVLTGFIRVATNRSAFPNAATATEALGFVDALRAAPRSRIVAPSGTTWRRFAELAAADPAIRANRVPDAWIAAHALAQGARLATADRGFGRFAGLDWFVPVT